MGTYSFLDVNASLAGPGGNISLGAGAGNSEEGITVEMKEEKNLQTVGADGKIMNSLRASNAGRISIRLLKTSPVNAALSLMYNFQKSSSGVWGQNSLVVSDVARGDVVSATEVAFTRQANLTYAKDGNMNEWIFEGSVEEILGAGVPDVNV